MEPYRIFISSIMNRSTEDLLAERAAARTAVEHFAPVTVAWAFEVEPASSKPLLSFYIDAAKTSDLLVLILGQHLTTPVRAECETARDHGKPMLVFCKAVTERAPEAEALLRSLNIKYDSFVNAVELGEKIRKALGIHILQLVRRETEEIEHPGDRTAKLRQFARNRTVVRVSPLIPPLQFDRFSVTEANDGTLRLEKESSDQQVTIPLQRVAEILRTGTIEPPTVMLNGRLQWLTLSQEWQFFPEPPDHLDGSGLGVPRDSSPRDPFVASLDQQLALRGLHLLWSHRDKLAERLNAKTHEVFYDTDGRYLRLRGPDHESILLMTAALS
jgi:hypothetical protein